MACYSLIFGTGEEQIDTTGVKKPKLLSLLLRAFASDKYSEKHGVYTLSWCLIT